MRRPSAAYVWVSLRLPSWSFLGAQLSSTSGFPCVQDTKYVCSFSRDIVRLISVGLPDNLRDILEAGPPEGILSRFNDMFKEEEEATHIRAAEVMRELGWDATD